MTDLLRLEHSLYLRRLPQRVFGPPEYLRSKQQTTISLQRYALREPTGGSLRLRKASPHFRHHHQHRGFRRFHLPQHHRGFGD